MAHDPPLTRHRLRALGVYRRARRGVDAVNTATAARRVVFLPTPTESFEAFRALERYAAATRLDPESGMNERLAASEDLNRVFTRFGARVFEEARQCNS